MNVSAFFIDRPVATTLLAIAIFLSGALAYFHLPVAPLPNVTFPVVVVQATLAGAAPETMAASVADAAGKRLATSTGVNQLTSTSYVGAVTSGKVDDGADMAAASAPEATTRHRARTCRRRCAPIRPGASQPGRCADHDPGPDLEHLEQAAALRQRLYGDQQQLSQIGGVGQITLGGAALPAVRIELEPDKLSSYGIGMEDVRAEVSAANADSAKGDIDQGGQRFEVTCNDQATTAADYRDLVIAYRNNSAVLLRDVAEVDDS